MNTVVDLGGLPRASRGQFRLVALDLDGTILPHNLPLSARSKQAVKAAQAQGVHVALITGRMFRSALPFAQELGLIGPLVCYGGALIKDPVTGEVLHHQGVPLELAREVVRVARRMRRPVNVYMHDEIYVDEITTDSPVYPMLMRLKAHAVGDLVSFMQEDPTHVAVVSEQSYTKQLVRDLREIFDSRLHLTSGHPLLAEAQHPDVSKGNAVALLASLLGVERAQVLAMGNDWNDVAMLSYAGLGVAIEGSPPEVLEVADLVAPPAEADGAAAVIEEWVLR